MRKLVRAALPLAAAATALTLTATSAHAATYGSTDQYASYSTGGYTVYNDEWGSGYGSQALWVNSASNWGVYSTQPNTSGIKSYPNVSKSIGTALDSLKSVSSSFSESNPGSGNWESAYDIWLNGSTYEVMIWTNVSGDVAPLGFDLGSVTLAGTKWTLYAGSNGSNLVYSLLRQGNETSATVDLLYLLHYLENTKGYFSNPTLSTIQYGWEITSTGNTGENFIVNSYSVSTS